MVPQVCLLREVVQEPQPESSGRMRKEETLWGGSFGRRYLGVLTFEGSPSRSEAVEVTGKDLL